MLCVHKCNLLSNYQSYNCWAHKPSENLLNGCRGLFNAHITIISRKQDKTYYIAYHSMDIPSNNDTMIIFWFMYKNLSNLILHIIWSIAPWFRAVSKISQLTSILHHLDGNALALILRQIRPKFFQLNEPVFRQEPLFTKFLKGCYQP